jgi:hypothetical protein
MMLQIFRQLDKTMTNQMPIVRCADAKARPHPDGRKVGLFSFFIYSFGT